MKRRLVTLPLGLGVLFILWASVLPPTGDVCAGPKRGYCACVYPNGGSDGCFDCPPGVNCASCQGGTCSCDSRAD